MTPVPPAGSATGTVRVKDLPEAYAPPWRYVGRTRYLAT